MIWREAYRAAGKLSGIPEGGMRSIAVGIHYPL